MDTGRAHACSMHAEDIKISKTGVGLICKNIHTKVRGVECLDNAG